MPETGQLLTEYIMGQAAQAMSTPEAQAQIGQMFSGIFDTPEVRSLLQAIGETRIVVSQLQQSVARIETTVQELTLQVAQFVHAAKPRPKPADAHLAWEGQK